MEGKAEYSLNNSDVGFDCSPNPDNGLDRGSRGWYRLLAGYSGVHHGNRACLLKEWYGQGERLGKTVVGGNRLCDFVPSSRVKTVLSVYCCAQEESQEDESESQRPV